MLMKSKNWFRIKQTPKSPKPMTASVLMAYLENVADRYPIEDEPIMVNGRPVVNATIVHGRVVLQTFRDFLADPNPDHH